MRTIYTEKHKLHRTEDLFLNDRAFIIEEIPARVEVILSAVQDAKLGPITPPDDHGLDPILNVHSPDYIDFLQNVFAEHAAFYQEEAPVLPETFATRTARRKPSNFLGLKGYYGFGTGSPILKGTWEAAYWSAQCALSAAELVRNGENSAYALCRPPGHHAGVDFYGGFCYLNNAAIASRVLGDHIAILDIDYHHGNGTQEIFYADPGVLYCSLHAHPDYDYPFYWGDTNETGAGPGAGFNHNWPLLRGTTDTEYLEVLGFALEVIQDYNPRYLVVSAGFDIIDGDPVGGFKLSTEGISAIGKRIASLEIPTVILQEGGYLLDNLGENAVAFLSAFGN